MIEDLRPHSRGRVVGDDDPAVPVRIAVELGLGITGHQQAHDPCGNEDGGRQSRGVLAHGLLSLSAIDKTSIEVIDCIRRFL